MNISNPANPISPLNPANPANPASPLNPSNPSHPINNNPSSSIDNISFIDALIFFGIIGLVIAIACVIGYLITK